MKLTVGICTWNRACLLDRTLRSMESLRIPEGLTWELLVANNNCTDATDAVLARHAGRLPLRRLFEEKPGKSNAANRIVAEAAGEWIVWTDDDVWAEPPWLEAYAAAIERSPEVDILGGTVLPEFEQEPPAWITDNLPYFLSVFAMCDCSAEPDRLQDRIPIGANMALRRAVHLRFSFDPRIGPRPGAQIRGEETVVIKSARGAGCRIGWAPAAVVRHRVPASRMTYQYLCDWWRGVGAEWALLAGPDRQTSRWFGVPRWLWKAQALESLKAALARLGGRSPRWCRHAINAQIFRGMARQYRAMARRNTHGRAGDGPSGLADGAALPDAAPGGVCREHVA